MTLSVKHGRLGMALAVVLLIAALGLRLWDLNDPSVWHDEGWSIRAIRDPIHTPDDNTPVAYYALMHLLVKGLGAGDSPLAMRYGSVLLDVITIALAIRIVRVWAGDWEPGILAGLLLGASPLLWAYAREIRAYVAVPLLTLLLLRQTERLLQRRELFPWRTWAGLLAVELLLLYTHNLSVPVVGWLNLVVVGVWLAQRRWRFLGIWLAGQVGLLLAYAPWVLAMEPSGTPLNTPPHVSLALVWDIWQGYFAPLPTQIGADNALQIGSALFGAAALVSVGFTLAWNRQPYMLLLLSQVVLLPVLATVELIAANIDFHPRYYVAGVPATLILVALGLNSVPAPYEIRRLVTPGLIALGWGVAAASLTGLMDRPQYQRDDFRALAQYYASLPEDALVVIPYGFEPALEEYYAEKVGIQAQLLPIDLHSSADEAKAQINAALDTRARPVHVELLTWYQVPADVRGMYPCLLETGGRPVESFTVQGITTQGYQIDELLGLIGVGDLGQDYGVLRLEAGGLGGVRAVCIQTAWQLQRPTDADWRVTARALSSDPVGWIVARSDTDIRRDDQSPTSDWEPGEQGEAFSLLRFPAGVPPQPYELHVGVYSTAEPNGLDRLVNGIPSGKLVQVAEFWPEDTTVAVPVPVPGAAEPVTMADGVTLVGCEAGTGALSPGQELRITLHWQAASGCCRVKPWTEATVSLRGEGWEMSQPVRVYDTYSLDWHAFVVPAEASGTATLTVESDSAEPVTLVSYTIEPTDRFFAAPPFAVAVGAEFSQVAVLEGVNVGQDVVPVGGVLDLTLVWRASDTPELSYRVFTHLLDANGRVIAQHDGYPVEGERLTTGWVSGEYVVDLHHLTFIHDDYRGAARLEVGFYDPETNYRVLLPNGADHVVLPVEIMVQ